jgi:hypothetical protein
VVDGAGHVVILGTLREGGIAGWFAVRPPSLDQPPQLLMAPGLLTWGRGDLGLDALELTEELRRHFAAPPRAGVMISRIDEAGSAARSALQVGDIVLTVDGSKVATQLDFASRVRRLGPGETARLRVLRRGVPLELEVQVGERRRPLIRIERQGTSLRIDTIASNRPGPLGQERLGARPERYVEDAVSGLQAFFARAGTQPSLALPAGRDIDWQAIEQRIAVLEQRLRELDRQLAERAETTIP